MKALVDLHDFRLSGLHKEPPHPPSGGYTPELTLLQWNGKRGSLPAAFMAVESALRLLGRTLYHSGIPHYIVNSAAAAFNSCDACTLIQVLVPDARMAFDCLKSAGMQADPMWSLSVRDRDGKVSIRLLQSRIA